MSLVGRSGYASAAPGSHRPWRCAWPPTTPCRPHSIWARWPYRQRPRPERVQFLGRTEKVIASLAAFATTRACGSASPISHRHAHQPPGEEQRALARIQHAREIIEAASGFGTAHRFMQGGDEIVMPILALVVDRRAALHHVLKGGGVEHLAGACGAPDFLPPGVSAARPSPSAMRASASWASASSGRGRPPLDPQENALPLSRCRSPACWAAWRTVGAVGTPFAQLRASPLSQPPSAVGAQLRWANAHDASLFAQRSCALLIFWFSPIVLNLESQ